MDVYRIGVSIVLTNSILPALKAMSGQLIGMNNAVTALNSSLGRMGMLVKGAAAATAGIAVMAGFKKLADHGAEVNNQLELMKIAGMSNADIQAASSRAMAVTSTNLTTTLSENLQHIRELRYAFGDVGVAMEHLDEISKSNTILNAVKGGSGDQVWELVKSLEQKGLTFDPKEFSSYVNTMTKVVEATGGKVTPKDFMSTFKYGRTAMLGWDEDFVGGALPRLMQSMGGGNGSGGPGNALMSSFAKVVQGQMSKTAAEEFARMGLAPGGVNHIRGSSESQLPGGIAGRDEFMANPYEWVQRTLMPALAAHNITSQNDIIAEISKLFPVRTASSIISEMGLQGRFHEGANSPFEKDIALQKGAMGQAQSFNELVNGNYKVALSAFDAQFHNLLQTLGSPLIQPGGPVLTGITGLTQAMNSMAGFASVHPEVIRELAYGIGALGVALTGGGIVAILAALGPAGWITAGIIGLGAAAAYLSTKIDFKGIASMLINDVTDMGRQIAKGFLDVGKIINTGVDGAVAALSQAASSISSAITSIGKAAAAAAASIPHALGIDPGGSYSSPGKTGKPAAPVQRAAPMGYWSSPTGSNGSGAIQIHNYIDGHKIGGHVIKTVVATARGPLMGATTYDQTRGYGGNDMRTALG